MASCCKPGWHPTDPSNLWVTRKTQAVPNDAGIQNVMGQNERLLPGRTVLTMIQQYNEARQLVRLAKPKRRHAT